MKSYENRGTDIDESNPIREIVIRFHIASLFYRVPVNLTPSHRRGCLTRRIAVIRLTIKRD